MSSRSGSNPSGSQGTRARNQRQQTSSRLNIAHPGVYLHSPVIDSDPESREMQIDYYNSLLRKLLDLIANGDEASVSSIVSTIRAGASHDRILEIIEQLSAAPSRTNGSNGTHSRT
ncbi:hypothetical protein N7478_002443 [Penicillium angulare]|uniref:uncharacterized protein n=1 Tax=Penicillium angulare TaxID=116970 RepID=UPI00253FFB63|nr:uncharacterized protein N7478_002443 [Penicillium angulare]KAJ5286757.1 hypothetical protein N7478_002443 [Penicillium angulare]